MRILTVQVQPSLAPSIRGTEIIRLLQEFSESAVHMHEMVIDEEDHGSEYINFSMQSDDVGALWCEIKDSILSVGDLAAALETSSIVVCQGSRGWDDYLLLHHFDPDEELDQF